MRTLLLLLLGGGLALAADPAAAPPPPSFWTDSPAAARLDTPDWFAVGGEVRYRFEDRRGLGFREGADDAYGLVRTRVDLSIKPKPWLEVFFQGQDARAPAMENATGVFRDPFDVRQAYVRAGGGEGSKVSLTVGRQLLLYGDQRLIGPLDWTNTSRAFDAVKLQVRPSRDVALDFFSAAVVVNDPERRVNPINDAARLHGFYGSIVKLVPRSTLEPFVLLKTSPPAVNELSVRGGADRWTGGFRLWSKSLGPWDYNLSFAKQWGDVAGADIDAWGAYGELGYTFDAAWTPRLYAEYSFGSGDSDPADGKVGGFDDLFPTAHLWYGYNDVVGWRNLKNVRVGAQFRPARKLKASVDFHSFWLANRRDGLYNVAGIRTVAAPAEGAADAKIGDELDLTFTVPLTKILTLGGGVGRFFPGPFVEAHGPGGANTFTFLFAAYRF